MTRSGAAVALAGVLLACASPEDPGGAPDPPESDPMIELIGDVMVTGSERDTMLVIVTGTRERYELVGDLTGELWRLQPFGVTVRGRVVRHGRGPVFPAQLQVDSYTLAQRPS